MVRALASWMECACHSRLDEEAKGQGGHLLSPFLTFVGQSWVRGWTMSLLFLERRNFSRDNRALSALAWGAVTDSTLPCQALTNVIKKWGQFSPLCLGLPPALCDDVPFFFSSADLASSPMT